MSDYLSLKDKDYKYIWHPFTQMKSWIKEDPLIIEKGQGNNLIDVNGNSYIDAYGSLWCNVHGHNVPELNDAIIKQIGKVSHSTMLGASNVPAIELSEKLIEIAPKGLNKVFYSDSGSEAMEIALKMAYQYWKHVEGKDRKTFITFENSYHGDTVGSVSLGGIPLFKSIFKGLLFDTIIVPSTYSYRMDMTLDECGDIVLGKIEKALKENQGDVISVVIEPRMMGAAGMIVHPHGFVKKVKELTEKYNTLLICDEVATGFGRTGDMFSSMAEDVCPDLMAVAKGISGGYLPIAATLSTDKIFNAFLGEPEECKTFYHGHTYTGNQLASAVSIANIDLMKKNDTVNHVKNIAGYLENKLEKLKSASPYVGDVRQRGVMTGIEIVKNKKTKEAFLAEDLYGHKIIMECRKYGVLTRNLGDVIILNPPLSITKTEIDVIVDSIEKSISKIIETN